MGVQLNIKSAEARELAEKLAAATGESLTEAVTRALEERLRKVRKLSADELIAKWTEIGRRNRELWPEMPTSDQIDDLLYDEDGLPK